MIKEAFSLVNLEPARNEYVKSVGTIEATETLDAITSKMCLLHSEQIALVTITLDFAQEARMRGMENDYHGLAGRSARYYLDHLRSLVRTTDSVFLLHQTFYFILAGANQQGGEIVQERLWDALLWHVNNTLGGDYLRPCKIAIGHSACSAPFIDACQCINTANEPLRILDLQPEKPVYRTEVTKDGELLELARQLGVPYVSFLPHKLPVRLKRLVDPILAQELHCFPLGRDRGILTVAMSNPGDHHSLDRLRKETGLTIFPVLAHPSELQTALEQFS
jgi:hypothetical protein